MKAKYSLISLILILFSINALAGEIKIDVGPSIKADTGASFAFGTPESEPQNINLWMFIGQSNTAAADSCINTSGCITDLVDESEQTTADQAALLYCYSAAVGQGIKYAWGDIRGYPGSKLGEYVDGESNPYMVGGDEVTFNRNYYTASPATKNAYIKYYGNYNALQDGHSAWYPGKTLYVGLTAFIDARKSDLEGMGYTVIISGIVYHQGIDDGILHRSQNDYENDIKATFAGLRTLYGAGLPIVVIRSVNSPVAGSEYMAPIRAAQVDMGTGGVANCTWVSNDDLEIVNQHHLSFAAHLTLGGRVYTAMMGLIE